MSDRKLSSSQDNKTNKKTKTDPPFPRTAKYSKMNEGDPEEVGSDRGAVSILKSDDYDHPHGKGERKGMS